MNNVGNAVSGVNLSDAEQAIFIGVFAAGPKPTAIGFFNLRKEPIFDNISNIHLVTFVDFIGRALEGVKTFRGSLILAGT